MKQAPESKPESAASKLSPAFQMEIRKATDAIRCALKGLEPGRYLDLSDVSAAFLQVQLVIDLRRPEPDKIFDRESETPALLLTEFRAALAEWDRQLPRLHGWLLAQRARLIAQQSHAGSVQTWIETDRQTL